MLAKLPYEFPGSLRCNDLCKTSAGISGSHQSRAAVAPREHPAEFTWFRQRSAPPSIGRQTLGVTPRAVYVTSIGTNVLSPTPVTPPMATPGCASATARPPASSNGPPLCPACTVTSLWIERLPLATPMQTQEARVTESVTDLQESPREWNLIP